MGIEWALDRLAVAALILFVLWVSGRCWRALRANQRVALGDAFESKRDERRSLLV